MTLVEEMCTVNNTDPVKVLKVSQRVQEINNGHDFICRDDMKKGVYASRPSHIANSTRQIYIMYLMGV